MEQNQLRMSASWVEVVATQQDWDAADPQLLVSAFAQLILIRAFEEYVLELAAAGLIHGPAHSSIGQEGGAVGSILALNADDTVNGSHRGHHQFLAKALSYVAPKGIDPVRPFPDEVRSVLPFLDHVPDRERAEAAFRRVGELTLANGLVALDPAATGEVHGPLDFAPTPDTMARRLFSDEVVEAHLDHLLAAQRPDGGWTVNFPAWTEAAGLEWRAFITVHNLGVLRAYGRL